MDRFQGLGAPVRVAPGGPASVDLDPALDDCCRREVLANRRADALQRTLDAHTHVLLRQEQARRNLVQTLRFSGCRCCYDPDNDGTGDYRALEAMREARCEGGTEPAVAVTMMRQDGDAARQVHSEKSEAAEEEDSDGSDSEYDYLLDDDSQDEEMKQIEEQRRAQLQVEMLERQLLQQHGYGVHRQMHPTRVLKAAGLGGSCSGYHGDSVVLHLYDPDSTTCAQLDLYLEKRLAPKFAGTKFLRCGGRSCLLMDADLASKALGRLHADRDVPALLAIKQGVVIASCPGLQGMQDSDGNIVEREVEEWLDHAGVLSNEAVHDVCRIRPEEDALMDYLMQQKQADDREKVAMFHCGVEGCQKAFYHEHVGVKTEHQSGLVVNESDVLGQEKMD